MGHVLPRRTSTGAVLSVASSDSDEFGALTEITARAGSQLVAYPVVAAIVLTTSLPPAHPAGDQARGLGRRRVHLRVLVARVGLPPLDRVAS